MQPNKNLLAIIISPYISLSTHYSTQLLLQLNQTSALVAAAASHQSASPNTLSALNNKPRVGVAGNL
jgi:hypothetical protein